MTPDKGSKRSETKPKAPTMPMKARTPKWNKFTDGRLYAQASDREDGRVGVRVTLSKALSEKASDEIPRYFWVMGNLLQRAVEAKSPIPQFPREEAGPIVGRGCIVPEKTYVELVKREKAEKKFYIDSALNALLSRELVKPSSARELPKAESKAKATSEKAPVKAKAASKAPVKATSVEAPRPTKTSAATAKLMAENPPTVPANGASMKRDDQPALSGRVVSA